MHFFLSFSKMGLSSVREAIEVSLLLLVSSEGIRVHLRFGEAFLCEEFIDAGCVLGAANSWLEGHFVLFPGDGVPVNIHEKRVPLKVEGIIFSANTLGWISLEKLLEQAGGLRGEVLFHWYWFLGYVPEHLLTIFVVVWWTATEHLV